MAVSDYYNSKPAAKAPADPQQAQQPAPSPTESQWPPRDQMQAQANQRAASAAGNQQTQVPGQQASNTGREQAQSVASPQGNAFGLYGTRPSPAIQPVETQAPAYNPYTFNAERGAMQYNPYQAPNLAPPGEDAVRSPIPPPDPPRYVGPPPRDPVKPFPPSPWEGPYAITNRPQGQIAPISNLDQLVAALGGRF